MLKITDYITVYEFSQCDMCIIYDFIFVQMLFLLYITILCQEDRRVTPMTM